MKIDIETLDAVVNKWSKHRETFKARGGAVTRTDVEEFVTTTNKLASELMAALGRNSPEYMETLAEIAMCAHANLMKPVFMQGR